MINFQGLHDFLKESELADWSYQLPQLLKPILEEYHGDKARWQKALAALPEIQSPTLDLVNGCVVNGNCDQIILKKALKGLMPWRKGPFQFSSIFIDTEWRSDWKWERIAPYIDLTKKRVLDVGCGNGYYGFRMLGAGARFVLGIDPNWLFLHQFSAFKHYAPELPIWQLPWTLEDFTPNLEWFDITFSMGVLYHRRSPIDHLIELRDTLRVGGTLVLETLVVEGDINTALMPHDRYAQMRNVWFLPSVDALMLWLKRAGFSNIRVADLTKTTVDEQHSTEWMAYQSLKDFLDPSDSSKTIEGYPAPLRVVLLADKGAPS